MSNSSELRESSTWYPNRRPARGRTLHLQVPIHVHTAGEGTGTKQLAARPLTVSLLLTPFRHLPFSIPHSHKPTWRNCSTP